MESFLSIVFEPIKAFLVSQGVWDALVSLYNTLAAFVSKLTAYTGIQTPGGSTTDFLLQGLKLVVDIFVTIIKVFIQILNWVIEKL